MTIWRVRIACWITKATEYTPGARNVYCLRTAKRLRERASVLRLHIRCFSCVNL